MMTTILGIDPGMTGAIAQISPMEAVWDMPETPHNIAALLATFDPASTVAYVERVSSMPGQGVASTFKFGYGFGVLIGCLASRGIRYELVTPGVWKRAMGLSKDKSASRQLAQSLYPALASQLARARDDGRAEALLIAEWGKRRRQG